MFVMFTRRSVVLPLLIALAVLVSGPPIQAQRCLDIFAPQKPLAAELMTYQSARSLLHQGPGARVERAHGWQVRERDGNSDATLVRVRILVDNDSMKGRIRIIGPFNDWGQRPASDNDTFKPVPGESQIYFADVRGLKHGMSYRLMIDDKQVIDPTAAMYMTREYAAREGLEGEGKLLNSVFWDLEHPKRYQMRTEPIDLHSRPVLIHEIELRSLIAKFPDRQNQGQVGPRQTADTYRFVAESGVIDVLKEQGINAVEMLPFNQSMDGDSWHLRYQIYGLWAPDSRYGNPSEFKRMIDVFHRAGIAVIMDGVVSHFPFKGNDGARSLSGVGLDQWKKANGTPLYARDMSPWESWRYDYANPFVRKYLIESILFMMSEYRIDGIRMDNVDGIMSSEGGDVFIRELGRAIRTHFPKAFYIGESFTANNAFLHAVEDGGFGMDTRNDSDMFEIFDKGLLWTKEALNISQLGRLIRNAIGWGEALKLKYLNNHDEAANKVEGRLRGAYLAELLSGGGEYHAFGKIKAADSFLMLVGAYHLSFLQSRLMQRGSFYSNPAVEWNRITGDQAGAKMWRYFGALGRFMQENPDYFNFASLRADIENHVDDLNKVISLKRTNPRTGKAMYVLINLGDSQIPNYRFGIEQGGDYRIVVDSDRREFGGEDRVSAAIPGLVVSAGSGEHGRPYSLGLPVVPPYGVVVFEPVK